MANNKNERGAGRKPSPEGKGKQVSFYLNPVQEKAVRAYVANLRVNNDLLEKLKLAIHRELWEITRQNIDAEPTHRDELGDKFYGYDLDDYHREDVVSEWETSKKDVLDMISDAFRRDSEAFKVMEKIVEGVDYD